MATVSYSRQASPDEMAAEIDRRGRAIEALESELSTLKRQLEARGGVSEEAVEAAAEVMWTDRDARMGGAWKGVDIISTARRQTMATARAALEAAATLMCVTEGWKPISSARPKYGTLVWLFEPHSLGGFMFAGYFSNGAWRNNIDLKAQNPTHWMPLPAAPAPTAKEG